jgi:AraC family transcriptional regulator
MPPDSTEFTVSETHGMLLRPETEIQASSDGRAWTSLYASVQREVPFEDSFEAVDDPLIVLHLDGPVTVNCRVHKGENSRLIPPGGMVMMPGAMDFNVRLEASVQTLHLYLRRSLVEEVAQSILPGDPVRLELLPRFGECDTLIESLMFEVRDALSDDPSAPPYVDYFGRAIAARLIRAHSSSSPVPRAPLGIGRLHLSKAIDFMQASLEESIDLPAIAAVTGLSPSHFARQFRTTIGVAPHQYLMRLRIDRAKRLLRETNTHLVDIALGCGFANQEHLSRIFKRSCGIAPAAYRRALQR